MDDILAKKNRHLFLEEKDNTHNSFIRNINYAVENIDTIKTFNDNVNSGTMQHLLEAYIEQVGVDGNAWVLRLTELGESILATTSGFNYATVFTATTGINAGATITLPEAMKYRVGTHMLLVSWNGTVCYRGDQYEEIGAFNERSAVIKIKQDIKTGDKLEFRTVTLADIESVNLALGDAITSYAFPVNSSNTKRTLNERFSDIVNVKDFGAKGDGETDDTAAIQAAVDAARGRLIFIPEGIYVIGKDGVQLLSDSHVTGNGMGSTILVQPEAYRCRVWPGTTQSTEEEPDSTWSALFWSLCESNSDIRDISIKNMTLRGECYSTDYTNNPVYFIRQNDGINIRGRLYQQRQNLARSGNNYNICIDHVEIEGFGGSGIRLEQCENAHVTMSKITRCGCNGVIMYCCLNCWVEDNRIAHLYPGDADNNGNRMYGVEATRVYGNTAARGDPGTSAGALAMYRPSENVWISRNSIEDCLFWKGAGTHGGKNISFLNNTIIDCHYGIGIDMGGFRAMHGYAAPSDIKVIGNTLIRNAPDNSNEGNGPDYPDRPNLGCAAAAVNLVAKATGTDGGGDLHGNRAVISQNTMIGWGEKSRNIGAINVMFWSSVVISDNSIQNSRTASVSISNNDCYDISISGNAFKDVRQPAGQGYTYDSTTRLCTTTAEFEVEDADSLTVIVSGSTLASGSLLAAGSIVNGSELSETTTLTEALAVTADSTLAVGSTVASGSELFAESYIDGFRFGPLFGNFLNVARDTVSIGISGNSFWTTSDQYVRVLAAALGADQKIALGHNSYYVTGTGSLGLIASMSSFSSLPLQSYIPVVMARCVYNSSQTPSTQIYGFGVSSFEPQGNTGTFRVFFSKKINNYKNAVVSVTPFTAGTRELCTTISAITDEYVDVNTINALSSTSFFPSFCISIYALDSVLVADDF